jgi:hypothetical protein
MCHERFTHANHSACLRVLEASRRLGASCATVHARPGLDAGPQRDQRVLPSFAPPTIVLTVPSHEADCSVKHRHGGYLDVLTGMSQLLPVHDLESLVWCSEVGGGSDCPGDGSDRPIGLWCAHGTPDRPSWSSDG